MRARTVGLVGLLALTCASAFVLNTPRTLSLAQRCSPPLAAARKKPIKKRKPIAKNKTPAKKIPLSACWCGRWSGAVAVVADVVTDGAAFPQLPSQLMLQRLLPPPLVPMWRRRGSPPPPPLQTPRRRRRPQPSRRPHSQTLPQPSQPLALPMSRPATSVPSRRPPRPPPSSSPSRQPTAEQPIRLSVVRALLRWAVRLRAAVVRAALQARVPPRAVRRRPLALPARRWTLRAWRTRLPMWLRAVVVVVEAVQLAVLATYSERCGIAAPRPMSAVRARRS